MYYTTGFSLFLTTLALTTNHAAAEQQAYQPPPLHIKQTRITTDTAKPTSEEVRRALFRHEWWSEPFPLNHDKLCRALAKYQSQIARDNTEREWHFDDQGRVVYYRKQWPDIGERSTFHYQGNRVTQYRRLLDANGEYIVGRGSVAVNGAKEWHISEFDGDKRYEWVVTTRQPPEEMKAATLRENVELFRFSSNQLSKIDRWGNERVHQKLTLDGYILQGFYPNEFTWNDGRDEAMFTNRYPHTALRIVARDERGNPTKVQYRGRAEATLMVTYEYCE